MFNDSSTISLRKIPKYIDSFYETLVGMKQIDLDDPYKIPNFQTYFQNITHNLAIVNARWEEWKSSRNLKPQFISEKEDKIRKCATIINECIEIQVNIDQIMQSHLNRPRITQPKLLLADQKKPKELFDSVEERASVVDAGLAVLPTLLSEREEWIKQGVKLDMCSCSKSENRPELEELFLREMLLRYPPHPDFELSILSLGSGRLLQDWILLNEIVSLGYRKVHLHFTDFATSQADVESFKELIRKNESLSMLEINLSFSQDCFHKVKECRRFHGIHAIDFDSLWFESESSWKTLITAATCLNDEGFLLCSDGHSNYIFDATSSKWTIPDISKIICEPESEFFYTTKDLHSFWTTTFYDLSALVKLKAKKITVDVLEGNEEDLRTVQELSRRFFSSEVPIHIGYQKIVQENKYDFMRLQDVQGVDEMYLQTCISMIKPNGSLRLNNPTHSNSFRKIQIRKPSEAKKIEEQFEQLEELAKGLSISKSIHFFS